MEKDQKAVSKIVSYKLSDPLRCCGVNLGVGSLSAPILRSVGIEDGIPVIYVEVERYEGVAEENPLHKEYNIDLSFTRTGGTVWHTYDTPNTNYGGSVTLPSGEVIHIYYAVMLYDAETKTTAIL